MYFYWTIFQAIQLSNTLNSFNMLFFFTVSPIKKLKIKNQNYFSFLSKLIDHINQKQFSNNIRCMILFYLLANIMYVNQNILLI